jgi:RNA polymerase sigma factor (sigma-70 family)
MPSTSHSLLNYLRVWVGAWRDDPRDDATLLALFVESRDEAAFQVLVCRYGPLVWRTCQRILGDTPDTEDVFQTTFLILARKAGRLRREPLAGWLHRVARQAALNTDAEARRRRGLKQQLRAREVVGGVREDASRAELYAALDEELAGLPERLRVPLLLHYLDGKSQVEVARYLGCSRGVVRYRLARGEAALRKRLERRGLAVGVGSVAVLLGRTAGASAVPSLLMGSTVRTVLRSLSFPLESSTSAALVGGMMKTMLVTMKIKMVIVLSGLTLCLGVGGVLAYRTLAGNSVEPPQIAGKPRVAAEVSRRPSPGKQAAVRVDCHGDPLPEGTLARLGTLRLRHGGKWIRSVAFSPDGKTVLSGGEDHAVHLWDVATGKRIRTLQGGPAVAFSPDGKTVASAGGEDGTVCLWDAADGKEIRILRGHQKWISSVVFSPDGKTVASGGKDGTVRLWETATGKEIRTLKRHDGVTHVAFSPDGKTVASGGRNNTVRLWETATGKKIRDLKRHQGKEDGIVSVAFLPDGKTLASAGWDDSTVHLWEIATGKEIRTLRGHQGPITNIVSSPDGKIVVSAGWDDSRVCLWEVATGKKIHTLRGQGWQGDVQTVAFSPDGKTLTSGGYTVRLWEVATGKEIPILPEGYGEARDSVAFSSDGKTVASGGEDGTVRLWEMGTGKEIRTLKGHRDRVRSVAFSSDSKVVVSGGDDGAVLLWEVGTGKEIRILQGYKDVRYVKSVAFSPDGKIVAAGGNDGTLSQDERVHYVGTVRLWDTASGKEIRTLKGPSGCSYSTSGCGYSLVFSSDGKTVTAGFEDGTVCVWEVATGKEIRMRRGITRIGGNNAVAFSYDGKTVAVGDQNGIVRLWEIATGKEIRVLRGHNEQQTGVKSVAFAPDSRTVAAVLGQQVFLWDLFSGDQLPPLVGHQNRVRQVTFSPDSRILASVSDDTTCLIWDLTYGAARPGTKRGPDEWKALWTALGSRDAVRARRVVWTLAAATPEQSVSLLRDRLQPTPAPDPKRLAQLITDLDATDFKVRQKVYQEFEKLGPHAEAALRKGLEGNPSLEMRKRLEQLLETVTYSGESLRIVRAMEVLEQIGTSQARQVLQTLAANAPGSRLRQEAQAVLDRLDRAKRP